MFECVSCFCKTSSEKHCFCLKPTAQCTFTERIHCSNVCLNVYNVFKNFLWNPLLLLEAHHSLYFHRAHTLFNCMSECLYCFEKPLLKPSASAWSPPLTVLSQSADFVQLYVWICIMFWKTSSENHCFRLKPTTQCTFKERILFSIVCLNEYYVSMTSSESHCLCLKPNTHCTFTERLFVQLYGLLSLMFWKTSADSHCFCLKPTTQCTSKERILRAIVYLNV